MKTVTAAIIEKDGCVLVARRESGDRAAGKWEFPGGKVEPGESPLEGLGRELLEEFRVQLRVGPFFGESVYPYPHGTIRLLAYRVAAPTTALTLCVHDQIAWVPPHRLLSYDLLPADVPLARQWIAEQLPPPAIAADPMADAPARDA